MCVFDLKALCHLCVVDLKAPHVCMVDLNALYVFMVDLKAVYHVCVWLT